MTAPKSPEARARGKSGRSPVDTDGEPPFWPPRVVWAREKGWLEVRDSWTGEWFQIQSRNAPTGWVRLAMQARDPRIMAAELKSGRISDAVRRLPGYAD